MALWATNWATAYQRGYQGIEPATPKPVILWVWSLLCKDRSTPISHNSVQKDTAHNAIFQKLISWKSDGKCEPSCGKTTGGLALCTLISVYKRRCTPPIDPPPRRHRNAADPQPIHQPNRHSIPQRLPPTTNPKDDIC